MAVKNHALDEKITEAARAEFLDKGFRGASLQKIAARAGLTTGALYTRYKSKDELFCSLVREVLDAAAELAGPMEQDYMAARETGDPNQIMAVIRREEQIYRDLLFRCPEACMLLFCRSDGSSLETMLQTMMTEKVRSTVAYFKSIARSDQLDLDGVEPLISSQFYFYRQILEKGYDREKAVSCLKTVEYYMDAGWNALFEAIV